MKRFISFALAIVLLLSFTACTGAGGPTEPTAEPTQEASAPTEPPADNTEAPAEPTAEPAEPTDVPATPAPTAMPDWPYNDFGELPRVIAGDDVFFICYPDGSLYGWGNNEYGQVGRGGTENTARPFHIATGLTPVIVGETVFALSSDNVLWGWGRNDRGQLGLGDTENRDRPVELMHFVKQAVKGPYGGCYALTEAGELYFWGAEEASDKVTAAEPELVFENVTYIDGRYMIKDGELWVDWSEGWTFAAEDVVNIWGDMLTVAAEGSDGRLYCLTDSNGAFYAGKDERELIAESFRSVTVSDGMVWVITDDGSLLSYRAGFSSVTDVPDSEMHQLTLVMNEVVDFKAATYVDEDWGYDYKFALKYNGELWSWGLYQDPALGKTMMEDTHTPSCVARGVRRFFTTGAATYVIGEDGLVWASGNSIDRRIFRGGLGDGTTAERYGFVVVGGYSALWGVCDMTCALLWECIDDGDADWARITSRTFAVDAQGKVYAWGWNGDGLLGVGSDSEEVLFPTEVLPVRG